MQKHVEELRNVEYVGVDIVPELIENNKKQFKEWKKMRFEVQRSVVVVNVTCSLTFHLPWMVQTMDIVREPIGRSFDLIVCRDTLFHLPVFDAVQALKNFDASKSKFLLSHFDEELTSNWPDIKVGGWHLINLLEAPFKLSAPVEMVVEKGQDEQSKVQNHYGHARRLALWKLPAMKHTGEATRCQKTRREGPFPPVQAGQHAESAGSSESRGKERDGDDEEAEGVGEGEEMPARSTPVGRERVNR
ncbi:hypothetical protein GUITHDRAFT_101254 [Guillardia theta CCMP2712]|uniref:Uncharacterized protein n=1 Tax=Guillardia theta (strain CCMP2712) TaxID=905079 RepID=L1JXJ8_GUITC|nr:hypothetical protein GUITHDRAFT_101254 [Guillardia theta CCMP2712]EKX52803.1 hypothetical protein GUITHDRAFT_101254 [Guillardia theta CCMP2712]|eukprot:XP_005839783.1 hypothetical protein GUITHDRAFT_101254 [Guillardia theta CCMP2712]